MPTPTTESTVSPRDARARTPDLLVLTYAICVYLSCLAVLAYAVGFFADVGVRRSIDNGPPAPVAVACCVDFALLTLFAAQHSIMARVRFKRLWTRIVPPAAERATYVLATSAVLALLFWQWRPIGATVWQVPAPAVPVLWIGYGLGWALVVASTYLIDHADLFGLRQVWLRARRVDYRPPPFSERGLYRYLRHPLMAGFVIVFWSTPHMTAGHLLFAVVATGYILVGISFEERDLLRGLGARYAEYRARVPALIPLPRRRKDNRSTTRQRP